MAQAAALEKLVNALDRLPETALSARIGLCQQALALVGPQTPPEIAARLYLELGIDLLSLPSQRSAETLERAIAALEAARERYTPSRHLNEWAATVQNLALAYAWRIDGVRAQNVETAIALNTLLLEHLPAVTAAHARAHAHCQLGQLYMHRASGDRADHIETAIAHARQALEVWTQRADPLRRARVQSLLGSLYPRRLCGDPVNNLHTSIDCLQQALRVFDARPHGPDWAQAQHALGFSLWRLSQLLKDQQALVEQAIQHLQAALQVWNPDTHPDDWAKTQRRLAVAYLDRRAGDPNENVAQAIAWLEPLAHRLEAQSERWIQVQNDLGAAYLMNVHGGRSERIEQAIHCFRAALERSTQMDDTEQKALLLHNLAAAYDKRLLGERGDNLRQAADYGEKALKAIHRRDVSRRSLIQMDLAGILWRLGTLERVTHPKLAARRFEQAIAEGEAAIAALGDTQLGYHKAFASYNLGNAYSDRLLGDKTDNQERAIRCYNQALQFFTPDHFPQRWANAHSDLGITYLERQHGDPVENRRLAITHFEQALRVLAPGTQPIETLRIARNLAHTCFELHRWQDALEPYRLAIQAADTLYRSSLLRASKTVELHQVTELYACAAYALAQSGQEQEAAVTLERGRARLLADALERDRVHLNTLRSNYPEIHRRYDRCTQELEQLVQSDLKCQHDSLDTALAGEMRTLDGQMEQIIQDIRCIDGHERFLAAPDIGDIQPAAQAGVPIVYTAVTSAGSLVLIVCPDRIVRVQCPLTQDALRERILDPAFAHEREGYLPVYAHWRANPTDDAARTQWFATLDATCRWLWDALMGQIVDALNELGIERAVLISQGWLGLLPLHAAWTETNGRRQYALDRVCLTYTPNARALAAVRSNATTIQPSSIFAVDDPQPVSARSLHYSWQEVAAVLEYFERKDLLSGDAATEKAVRDKLRDYAVLHFSCHGNAGFERPLEGGLLMAHDQMLILREMLTLRLENVRLAVLSACETGIPGTDLPDEVIGLPTGLVQAGAAGVVASLWSVSDLSTMLLMARFYELWKQNGLEPPEALRQAQRWLRDTTNGEKAAYLKEAMQPGGNPHLPQYVAQSVYETNQVFLELRAGENDLAHPFYWAAFGYTGV